VQDKGSLGDLTLISHCYCVCMFQSPMMFTSVQDDVCMIMKFLSNSPVCHVAANTHPAVPGPAVTTISCNHNFAINKWNTNYQRKMSYTIWNEISYVKVVKCHTEHRISLSQTNLT